MAPIIWKPNPSLYFQCTYHIKGEAEKDAAGSRPVEPQLNLEFGVGGGGGGQKKGKEDIWRREEQKMDFQVSLKVALCL